MAKLMGSPYNYSKIGAAGLVGNMSVECGPNFDYTACAIDSDNFIAAGICGWNDRYGNLTHLLEKKPSGFGKQPINRISPKLGLKGVKEMLSKSIGIDYQIEFLDKTIEQVTISSKNSSPYKKNILNNCSTPEAAAESFRAAYERGSNSEGRQKNARKYYDSYDSEKQPSKKVEPARATKKEIYAEFMRCLQLSVNSTDNGKVTLLYSEGKNSRGEYLRITQKGGRDKLPLVFDIILDGYYDYVRELWWVYENENTIKSDPICIDVIVELNVDTNSRQVYIVDGAGKHYGTKYDNGANDFNTFNIKFLKSLLGKFHKSFDGPDLPQFPTFTQLVDNSNLFIADCEDVINTNNVPLQDVACGLSGGKIGDWNVAASVNWLLKVAKENVNGYPSKECKPGAPYSPNPDPDFINTKSGECEGGRCNAYVKRALYKGGFPNTDIKPAADMGPYLIKNGFKPIYSGTIQKGGNADYKDKCLGDITVHDRCGGHKYGHIDMWCGNQWVSDFKQNYNRISGSVSNKYVVYRYTGSGKG